MGTLKSYFKMQLQKCGFWFVPPRQLNFTDVTEQFLSAKAEYILNYTMNIIKLTDSEKCYYFRETKKHCKSLKECIFCNIDIFFREIVSSPELKANIKDHLKKKSNLRKLIYMGNKDEKDSNFNKYLTCGDERHVGLPLAQNESDKLYTRMLIFFLYGEINAFIWNAGVKEGDLQTFSAVRSLGVRRLSEILGVDYIIVPSKYVKIIINGDVKYGVLCDEATGSLQTDTPIESRVQRCTPYLLRSLTDFNILDALTFDHDHRIGNYYVTEYKNGKYEKICSYDNDATMVFALSAKINFRNQIRCSGIVRKDGEINRAHISETTANAVLSVDREEINTLSTYLNAMQIYCTWLRIKKLKKAIKKTIKNRKGFLLAENEWLFTHIQQDLCSQYGKTYLKSFLLDGYFENGLHDFDRL